MGYGRIDAISDITAYKTAFFELTKAKNETPIQLVQPKDDKPDISLYSNMGLEIKGESEEKDLHPSKAQVPRKTRDFPEPMSPHENMFLNITFPEMANSISVYPDNSYAEYDKKGRLINIRQEDGKLKLCRIQNRTGDNFKKYIYDEKGNPVDGTVRFGDTLRKEVR